MICKICDLEITDQSYEAREMMFGLKTLHTYFECSNCEALQIETVPGDLSKYYPDNYYSFNQHPDTGIHSTFFRRIKSEYLLFNRNKVLGSILCIGYKIPDYIEWLKQAGVTYDDAILDVGSGSGHILTKMVQAGFNNLFGIDPYLNKEFISTNGKLKLLQKSIFDEQAVDAFDLIMLNHSFEHMDEPQAIFQRLSLLVKPGKILLIRTPVNKSFASQKYKTNWVALDAPRHLVVHSKKSIETLANKYGFIVEKVIDDSNAFQFWGSEQYVNDIPLYDPRSYSINPRSSIFSQQQINEWKRQAKELNTKGNGDQACFYLRKT